MLQRLGAVQRSHSAATSLRLVAAAVFLGVPGGLYAQPAQSVGGIGPEPARRVHIAMAVENGSVRCSPSRVQALPRTAVDIQVVNRTDKPLWFVAPELFAQGDLSRSENAFDRFKGGFLVAPAGEIVVGLTTPEPGQYYYACSERGEAPNPRASGVLVLAADR